MICTLLFVVLSSDLSEMPNYININNTVPIMIRIIDDYNKKLVILMIIVIVLIMILVYDNYNNNPNIDNNNNNDNV